MQERLGYFARYFRVVRTPLQLPLLQVEEDAADLRVATVKLTDFLGAHAADEAPKRPGKDLAYVRARGRLQLRSKFAGTVYHRHRSFCIVGCAIQWLCRSLTVLPCRYLAVDL